ncbi:phenylalanine 4-monooxygenase [Vibrio sp. SCSIO 43136]|uniref:phenylalanine 4-monooxygenase n=1 Tax=Vibrio sp. SCSIO 43136 TaxID=2819101 RepID=UPI0020761CA6|nr:phenylalanine 4-monooxygenase [Vibrio sp. SCSIO 43136]USD68185.1 phenylalanine 4-monooxygenase [Vibrio sp. SCSIO 43136]
MTTLTQYQSKSPNSQGMIGWSSQENQVWHTLITRQRKHVEQRACREYLTGLNILNLPYDQIPQLTELNQTLVAATGWQCKAVPALISFDTFFALLSQKQFPVATFIRTEQELDYLEEPDIFHEVFGHCAMLTHPAFAEFTHRYGQLGLAATHEERIFLARLYWFTVEFGLLQTNEGIKIYGGGILSSPGETQYVYSGTPIIKPFDVVDVMRTPYRIDIMQPIYFAIEHIEQLFELAKCDLMKCVQQAQALGLHDPLYPPKQQ